MAVNTKSPWGIKTYAGFMLASLLLSGLPDSTVFLFITSKTQIFYLFDVLVVLKNLVTVRLNVLNSISFLISRNLRDSIGCEKSKNVFQMLTLFLQAVLKNSVQSFPSNLESVLFRTDLIVL